MLNEAYTNEADLISWYKAKNNDLLKNISNYASNIPLTNSLLSDAIIKRFLLGIDVLNDKHELIIPINRKCYIRRNLTRDDTITGNMNNVFNEKALLTASAGNTVFVCENIIDVIALYNIGVLGVSIVTEKNFPLIEELLKRDLIREKKFKYILAFNNTESGVKAIIQTAEILKRYNQKYRVYAPKGFNIEADYLTERDYLTGKILYLSERM